jgi:hypothetical protein
MGFWLRFWKAGNNASLIGAMARLDAVRALVISSTANKSEQFATNKQRAGEMRGAHTGSVEWHHNSGR